MDPAARLLIVDDDRRLTQSLADWLAQGDWDVQTAAEPNSAISKAADADVALIDLRLGPDDGTKLILQLRKRFPELAILAMTGYGDPDTTAACIAAGAYDCLTKPIRDDELLVAIERARHDRRIEAENRRLRQSVDRRYSPDNVLSCDYRMLKIFDVIDSVADARASILITGENGTGKSMIARAIHRRSSRSAGPFIEVACGALPDNLLESELFGHVAGAYTGANTDRKGKFELADGGTLFLDEIGTASPAMQVKLLRVLQELAFEPLGGTKTRTVDTRVILATNEDLDAAVADGRFRQDLFYRINVVGITLPPLRDRPGDIPLLADHFLRDVAKTAGRSIEGFDREAVDAMQMYHWPGNVRQLQNVVERAVWLSRSPVLCPADLPPEVLSVRPADRRERPISFEVAARPVPTATHEPSGPPIAQPTSAGAPAASAMSLRQALEAPERAIILGALKRNGWNREATSQQLEINRTTLYKKMKKLNLDDPRLQYVEQ